MGKTLLRHSVTCRNLLRIVVAGTDPGSVAKYRKTMNNQKRRIRRRHTVGGTKDFAEWEAIINAENTDKTNNRSILINPDGHLGSSRIVAPHPDHRDGYGTGGLLAAGPTPSHEIADESIAEALAKAAASEAAAGRGRGGGVRVAVE